MFFKRLQILIALFSFVFGLGTRMCCVFPTCASANASEKCSCCETPKTKNWRESDPDLIHQQKERDSRNKNCICHCKAKELLEQKPLKMLPPDFVPLIAFALESESSPLSNASLNQQNEPPPPDLILLLGSLRI